MTDDEIEKARAWLRDEGYCRAMHEGDHEPKLLAAYAAHCVQAERELFRLTSASRITAEQDERVLVIQRAERLEAQLAQAREALAWVVSPRHHKPDDGEPRYLYRTPIEVVVREALAALEDDDAS